MIFLDSGRDPNNAKGPGPGESLHRVWQMDCNWRETAVPDAANTDFDFRGWIPPTARDVRQEHIDGVGRDPEKPDFLRPASQSPLTMEGAGKTDPKLPAYIGALPALGVPEWDWERTWRAFMDKKSSK
jgi:hypothetical protein